MTDSPDPVGDENEMHANRMPDEPLFDPAVEPPESSLATELVSRAIEPMVPLAPDASEEELEVLTRYAPAIRAFGLAVCRAMFLPIFILFVDWELRDGYNIVSLRGAICRGTMLILPAVILLQILRNTLRKNGLVERHIRWRRAIVRGMLSCTNLIYMVAVPIYAFYLVLQTFEQGQWNDSLGRIMFNTSMLVIGIAFWRLARCMSKMISQQGSEQGSEPGSESGSESEPVHALTRIYSWALFAAAFAPLVICAMSVSGFHFGAEHLGWRLLASCILALFIALLTGFASRILLVTQYKVQLSRLTEVDAVNVRGISRQVNRLLSVTALVVAVVIGWKLWGDVFPANSYLDQVQLWKGAVSDAGEVTWITLRDVLTTIGVAVLTFVLSRNLPGLLELTILDWLPLDRGGRYAISFVCRYVVGILGILLSFQLLGFSWHSLQWLAAGLTVGLGFGLQEIFANLISGIIILIERPIRVGDYVTVNGTSGTVTRMQLRATTIQDWDHRELIVPNKKFITDDVMNWTLTDLRSRAVFAVGVAYGSDTDLVESTLLKIADEHPLVLKNPKPAAVFSEFADSSLNFELRVHIPHREVFPKVQHEINMLIDRAFNEADIEIAFPQRDIRVRSDDVLSALHSAESRDVDSAKGASSDRGPAAAA